MEDIRKIYICIFFFFFFQKASKTQNKSKTKHFTEMTIESSTQLDLNLTDDKNTPLDTPSISGCDVFPNGRVILCDHLHNRIILLSKTLEVLDTLTLEKLSEDDDDAWPYDISVLNDKMALVTLPELTSIQCIKVSSKLEVGSEFVTFEKECYGIHVSGTEIYVTLHNNPGDGEVRILDLKGKLKKQLGQQQIGDFMFQRPYHVTVSSKSGWIYVTDSITCMVTCLKPDGSVEYEFKSGSLKRPKGVCVDLEDNLLVCGNSSNNVLVVSRSANGHFDRTLLSANDGIDGPCAIAYNGTTHQLIVGCRSKKLPVFSV